MLGRMTGAHATTEGPVQPSEAGRGRLVTAGLAVSAVAAAPFAITGLFRLGLPTLAVLLVCVLAGAALLAVPRRGRSLSLGWAVGCLLWAAALGFVLAELGQDLELIG